MSACACMGPQNGEPLCPCRMQAAQASKPGVFAMPNPHAPEGLPELPEPSKAMWPLTALQWVAGDAYTPEQMIAYGEACARTALAGSGAGWVLVPREPTEAMRNAGRAIDYRADKIWTAMLGARPKEP